jgi:DNA-binding IclR family transcriptional regulator
VELEAEACEVRARGYALDDCEYQPDTHGIAAPVFVRSEVPAAIPVTLRGATTEQSAVRDLTDELLGSAAALGKTLSPPHIA